MSGVARDVRAELEAKLLRDPEIEWEGYRQLAAPNEDFPDVYVHNDVEHIACDGPWVVSMDTGILDADVADTLALIQALSDAARQAEVLNSSKSIAVPWMFDSHSLQTLAAPEGAHVFTMQSPEEARTGWLSYRVDYSGAWGLDDRTPGETWFSEIEADETEDDRYTFTYLGRFRFVSIDSYDGELHSVLSEVPRG